MSYTAQELKTLAKGTGQFIDNEINKYLPSIYSKMAEKASQGKFDTRVILRTPQLNAEQVKLVAQHVYEDLENNGFTVLYSFSFSDPPEIVFDIMWGN